MVDFIGLDEFKCNFMNETKNKYLEDRKVKAVNK